jgi:Tol biopolymer transport system component
MKKLSIGFLVAMFLMSCTLKEKTSPPANYAPETPRLSSDIMTPEALWSFGRLGETAVSPDGSLIAYTVTWFNIEEDRSYRDIYRIDSDGQSAIRLTDTPEREFNIQWRPDGKKIGYLSSKSGSVQMWEMNADGSGQRQISNVSEGISGFSYSPDQKNICYYTSVKLDPDIHDLYPDLPKSNARLENDLMYRHWDSWHDYTYNHIFIAGYTDGKISEGKDIMPEERFDAPMKPFGGMEEIAWSPDGKNLAYTCKKLTGKAYAVSTRILTSTSV